MISQLGTDRIELSEQTHLSRQGGPRIQITMMIIMVLASLMPMVHGNVDEYFIDTSFECPAKTLCPRVCVPTVLDCPIELQCPENKTLCNDGTCSESCNPTLVSPCSSECASVACPLIIDYLDACTDRYTSHYLYASECAVSTDAGLSSGSKFSWSDPAYIFVYAWVIGVTAGIVGWCWFNHRICPVEKATMILQVQGEGKNITKTYQTGCKRHPIGAFMHTLTLLTYLFWGVLLSVIVYYYYDNFDNEADVIMMVKAICLTWNFGIVWCLTMQWPHSIESLFLRRCTLNEATQVAVYHENNRGEAICMDEKESMVPSCISSILDRVFSSARKLLIFIFADPKARPDRSHGILEYCPVRYNPDGSRYFVFLFRRYNYDEEKQVFVQGEWCVGKTFREMAPKGIDKVLDVEIAYERALRGDTWESPSEKLEKFKYLFAEGLTTKDVIERRAAVGPNVIEMIKPSLLKAFADEITRPFYIYQFYILWIWVIIDYWYMAIVNGGLIVMTGFVVSWFRHRASKVLYGVSHVTGTASVVRNDKLVVIPQTELVPGDIVQLSPGLCHADLVLLDGEAIVDESALTGEATPQAKAPIDPKSDDIYIPQNYKRQTISAGTRILECEDSLALVVKTASYTTKGELLRDVLAFRSYIPQHERELPTVVAILVCWSMCCFLCVMFNSGDIPVVSWSLGMAAWSNSFPSLLPISFTVPVGISFNRLAKMRIACASSDSIVIAGRVSRAFFDKTGTLTKQGLDYVSCRSVDSWDVGQWSSEELEVAMSTCHSLVKTNAGDMIGNPVDQAMFSQSKAKLQKVSGNTATIRTAMGEEITVLRRFDFDHNTMTQSVVVRLADGRLKVYAKGSGESICKLCNADTIPETFEVKLRLCSRIGIYQIAVATKEIASDTNVAMLSRHDVEKELNFLGVLNFSNLMRTETPDVIRQLAAAHIQSIMMTGDNIFTGIHIARQSGLIGKKALVVLGVLDDIGKLSWINEAGNTVATPDPVALEKKSGAEAVAMSGAAWSKLLQSNPREAIALAPHIRIFARCSPQDKVSVVDTFVALGSVTFMCGDGGNDCGALKAAHVGLALSDSDASIVAPFTSLDKDITAVVSLLIESRAALASTMATYKFIQMYGQITAYIQVIMYQLNVSFSDWMWTFADGIWTVGFTMAMPLSLPAEKLSMTRPTGSLIGKTTLSSVAGMMLLHISFMAIALYTLFHEDWYQCRKWDGGNLLTSSLYSISDNYEVEVIFLMVSMQIISSAFVFNLGYEFRRNWSRNWAFVLLFIANVTIYFYVIFVPGNMSCLWRVNCSNEYAIRGVLDPEPVPINNPHNMTVMPTSFRFKICAIAVGNGLAVLAYDFFIVNGLRRRAAYRKLKNAGLEEKSSSDTDDLTLDA